MYADVVALLTRSDEVIHYTVLTMIHRAIPPATHEHSTFSTDCLKAARSALDGHVACAAQYQNKNVDMWSLYLHW
jgi:hypothetical protein